MQARDGLYLLRNDAESFVETPISPLQMRDLEVAEVTGDDRLDVISVRENTIHVFEQVADGAFLPDETYEGRYNGEGANPTHGWAFAAGDVTGDGRADLVMLVDELGTTQDTTLNLFVQTETGGFEQPVTRPISTAGWSVEVADVDRSGRKDIVIGHGHDLGVGVLLSTAQGLGREVLHRAPSAGSSERSVATANLGGSVLGIVTAAENTGMSVLRNPVGASRLVSTSSRELRPFLGSGYLSWTRARKGRPGATDAFVRAPNGRVRKVNRPGTEGWAGGISGNRMAYQEIDRGDSDIRFYNLTNGARSAPRAVNTARGWEYGPSLSGKYLLFGRLEGYGSYLEQHMLLKDMSSPGYRAIGGTSGFRTEAITGQANGDYSVWTECVRVCNVFRYRFSRYDRYKIANPLERVQYAPAVASDGTVFYAQSGFGCGNNVRFIMRTPGDRPRLLLRLPRGIDVFNSSIGRDARGREMLVFDRLSCRTQQWDIYGL